MKFRIDEKALYQDFKRLKLCTPVQVEKKDDKTSTYHYSHFSLSLPFNPLFVLFFSPDIRLPLLIFYLFLLLLFYYLFSSNTICESPSRGNSNRKAEWLQVQKLYSTRFHAGHSGTSPHSLSHLTCYSMFLLPVPLVLLFLPSLSPLSPFTHLSSPPLLIYVQKLQNCRVIVRNLAYKVSIPQIT